jgi:hypothetical protein
MYRSIACIVMMLLVVAKSWAAKPCAKQFEHFLTRFEVDQQFQRSNTQFPLQATYVDSSAEPEPKTVAYTIINAADANYATVIFPNKQKQLAVPFVKSISHTQGIYGVKLMKPDTDFMLEFSFKKTSACWQLIKFEDFSL